MPTVLITGITGQDGSYLSESMLGAGWSVHGLVRSERAPSENDVADGIAVHVGDLGDPDSVHRIISSVEPDLIVNLGGVSSVAQSWSDPEQSARITGLGAAALLHGAWTLQNRVDRPVRFVQASSSEIFGDAIDSPQTENTRISPSSPYGAAKSFAHHLVGVYRSRGLGASSAILYNHESPRRPPTFVTRKITMGAAAIARGRSDRLTLGNLDAERDWGWAPDYADALLRIAEAPDPDDFIVATGVARSVGDFVAAAFAAAGIDDWQRYVGLDPSFERPADTPVMVGDSTKIRTELSWEPSVRFEKIVEAMVKHDLELLD